MWWYSQLYRISFSLIIKDKDCIIAPNFYIDICMIYVVSVHVLLMSFLFCYFSIFLIDSATRDLCIKFNLKDLFMKYNSFHTTFFFLTSSCILKSAWNIMPSKLTKSYTFFLRLIIIWLVSVKRKKVCNFLIILFAFGKNPKRQTALMCL